VMRRIFDVCEGRGRIRYRVENYHESTGNAGVGEVRGRWDCGIS